MLCNLVSELERRLSSIPLRAQRDDTPPAHFALSETSQSSGRSILYFASACKARSRYFTQEDVELT